MRIGSSAPCAATRVSFGPFFTTSDWRRRWLSNGSTVSRLSVLGCRAGDRVRQLRRVGVLRLGKCQGHARSFDGEWRAGRDNLHRHREMCRSRPVALLTANLIANQTSDFVRTDRRVGRHVEPQSPGHVALMVRNGREVGVGVGRRRDNRRIGRRPMDPQPVGPLDVDQRALVANRAVVLVRMLVNMPAGVGNGSQDDFCRTSRSKSGRRKPPHNLYARSGRPKCANLACRRGSGGQTNRTRGSRTVSSLRQCRREFERHRQTAARVTGLRVQHALDLRPIACSATQQSNGCCPRDFSVVLLESQPNPDLLVNMRLRPWTRFERTD